MRISKRIILFIGTLLTSVVLACQTEGQNSPESGENESSTVQTAEDSLLTIYIGKFRVQLTPDSMIHSFQRIDSVEYFPGYRCEFFSKDGIKELEWKTDSSYAKLNITETAKYFLEVEGASTYSIASFGLTIVQYEFSELFAIRMELVDGQLRRLRFKRNKKNDGPQFYYDDEGRLTSSVLRIQGERVMVTSFDGIFLDKETNDRYREKWEGRITQQSAFLRWSDVWEEYFSSW